jgi:hypothetical protein
MTFGTCGKEIFVVSIQGNRIVFQCFDYTLLGQLEYRSETGQDVRNQSHGHARNDPNHRRLDVEADG